MVRKFDAGEGLHKYVWNERKKERRKETFWGSGQNVSFFPSFFLWVLLYEKMMRNNFSDRIGTPGHRNSSEAIRRKNRCLCGLRKSSMSVGDWKGKKSG